MGLFGLAVGLLLGVASMVGLVRVPPECGEPSACASDFLLPGLPIALAAAFAMPIVAFVAGKRGQWRRVFSSVAVAAGLAVAFGCVAYAAGL